MEIYKSDAVGFFMWMQKGGRNWRYYNMPGWRSLYDWYKEFKKPTLKKL
jgi:hypothetical protein